jgi:hypothetical protein
LAGAVASCPAMLVEPDSRAKTAMAIPEINLRFFMSCFLL